MASEQWGQLNPRDIDHRVVPAEKRGTIRSRALGRVETVGKRAMQGLCHLPGMIGAAGETVDRIGMLDLEFTRYETDRPIVSALGVFLFLTVDHPR